MKEICVKEVLNFLEEAGKDVEYQGDYEFCIKGFCSLNKAKHNCITWIKNKPEQEIEKTENKLVLIVCNKFEGFEKCGQNFIFCNYPKEIFFSILEEFYTKKEQPGISPKAIVEASNIGGECRIGAGSYIGENVVIKDKVVIGKNVVIEGTVIVEEGAIIHSGTVIGTDGFGYYKTTDGISEKVPHFGGVKIGKNVEIGANCCIDRGCLDDTVIGDYVKIDNLCHIAHNVNIGRGSKIIALSLLAGSVQIGEESYIAPGCLIKNQVAVGKQSVVGMGAMVLKDVEEESVVVGYPAKAIRKVTEEDRKL